MKRKIIKRDSKYGGRSERETMQTRLRPWQRAELERLSIKFDINMCDITRHAFNAFLNSQPSILTVATIDQIENAAYNKCTPKIQQAKFS